MTGFLRCVLWLICISFETISDAELIYTYMKQTYRPNNIIVPNFVVLHVKQNVLISSGKKSRNFGFLYIPTFARNLLCNFTELNMTNWSV